MTQLFKARQKIEIRRQQPASEVGNNGVLGRLLENDSFPDDILADSIVNLLFARTETTANTLLFVVYFLTQCPIALKQVMVMDTGVNNNVKRPSSSKLPRSSLSLEQLNSVRAQDRLWYRLRQQRLAEAELNAAGEQGIQLHKLVALMAPPLKSLRPLQPPADYCARRCQKGNIITSGNKIVKATSIRGGRNRSCIGCSRLCKVWL